MSRIALTLAAVSSLVLGSAASAAIVPTIEFNTVGEYTNNFAVTQNGSNIGYNVDGGNVRYAPIGNNGTSTLRYDTDNNVNTIGPADFLTETLRVDGTFNNLASSGSLGLYTRLTSGNLGVLALVNPLSASSVQLRLFYDASLTGTSAGTAFYAATFDLAGGGITPATGTGGTGSTNGIAANSALTLTLAQSATGVFNLTVSDAQGLVASTGNQTLTASSSYNNAGSVGIRANLGAASGNTILIDNFAAVPEPTTLAAVALAGAALLGRRRTK